MNSRVNRITRWQARLGGFVESPSPSLEATEDKVDDGDFDDNDDVDDKDEDASSPSDDERTAWFTYPLSFMTKRESSFDKRVVMYIGGKLA